MEDHTPQVAKTQKVVILSPEEYERLYKKAQMVDKIRCLEFWERPDQSIRTVSEVFMNHVTHDSYPLQVQNSQHASKVRFLHDHLCRILAPE